MGNFLENLRNKPEGYRRAVALGTSLVASLVLLVVWLSVILPGSTQEVKVVEAGTKYESPLGAFGRTTAQAFVAIRGQLESLRGIVEIFNTVYTSEGQAEVTIEPVPER